MNVPFNQISTKDAATMIGVHVTSVINWCNDGLVPYTDVSNGTGKKRIMLNEEDVMLLKAVRKQYGGREVIKHVRMDAGRLVRTDALKKPIATINKPIDINNPPKPKYVPVKKPIPQTPWDDEPADEMELFSKQAQEQPQRFDDSKLPSRKVDIDEIAIIVGEIQDIKERLENLEAEKNQLLAELEHKRKIVMDAL